MQSDVHLFVGLTPLIGIFDMPTALVFHKETLGFEVISTSPIVETPEGRFSHWVWLRLAMVDVMLNTLYDSGERPAAPVVTRTVAHGDTGFYIGCSDIDAAYQRFCARGLVADPPELAPYGLKRFSTKDPDGYAVVFQAVR